MNRGESMSPSSTPTESTLYADMNRLADVLREGDATPQDRDRAVAFLIELWCAEHENGVVTVPECVAHKKEICERIDKALQQSKWGFAKCFTIFSSCIGFAGIVSGALIKIWG